jgi:hypothetical protein
LQVPRDRAGSFDPRIVRKGQRRLEGFNDRIIAPYARGMTTRDIRAPLREIYDVDVSADLISRVTDAVVEELAEWRSRPLDSAWSPSVVADASEGRRSHVAVCAEQDAGRGEAPVLRVDQDGHEGCCGRAGGGRVDQLRVGVVPDAGGVLLPDQPVSPRFFSQDDRIAIADGLRAGRAVTAIAAELGKSHQSVYREIRRNRRPDGSYQPWWAHNQASAATG